MKLVIHIDMSQAMRGTCIFTLIRFIPLLFSVILVLKYCFIDHVAICWRYNIAPCCFIVTSLMFLILVCKILYIKKDHLRILWHSPYYGDCMEEGLIGLLPYLFFVQFIGVVIIIECKDMGGSRWRVHGVCSPPPFPGDDM